MKYGRCIVCGRRVKNKIVSLIGMLTRISILNEYMRLDRKYRDTYIEEDGYIVVMYCDVKSSDEVRFYKDFNRLIICIGGEKVEYKDIEILDNEEFEEFHNLLIKMDRDNINNGISR